MWAVLFLRPYLENTRFIIRTDHDYLKWIFSPTNSTERLVRWCLRLLYEFDFVHRAGVKHQATDALSRLQTTEKVCIPLESNLQIPAIYVTEYDERIFVIDANSKELLSLKARSPPTDNTVPRKEEMVLEQASDHY